MSGDVHVRFREGLGVRLPWATRLVIAFALECDARRIYEVLPKRFGRFGLTLHPEKTRLVRFYRPERGSTGKGRDHRGGTPGSFDLLGFTHSWQRSRRGNWVVKRKTATSRFRRALKRVAEWCRLNRHLPVEEQRKQLGMKLRGHCEYYGITGNSTALSRFSHELRRVWRGWLNRRSQRARMSWAKFEKLLQRYPLPSPKCVHSELVT